MTKLSGGVLGVFSSMGELGGVERSALEAWRAIAEASAGPNHVLSFGPPIPSGVASLVRAAGGSLLESQSHLTAALHAASRRWPVRLVLFWHIGLVKLLPCLRTTGARNVLFIHGVEAWRKPSPAVARLLRQVDLFLTNSNFTWETFLRHHPDLRAAAHCTVPLGLDVPLEPNSAGEPDDPPSALMIGRIAGSESYKGHDAVIAAWPLVTKQIPGARLRMIGPSDVTPELRALAVHHGVADVIEISGSVSDAEKQRALAACRCMALPSLAEGFGLVYVESMRMGRPCIISTHDAGREVVCPDAGLAVDPANPSELAAALVRLMTPGAAWDNWSAAATRRYNEHYTAQHFRERLIAALAGSL